MLYSMQSLMRNSRRYPPLKLLRKHRPFSRQPMKELRLSRIQNFRGFEEIKMEEDESFDKVYAKLKDIVNLAFNLRETIHEPKIVRKVLRSLPERFYAKITAIEESKEIDKIPLTELVGNLQTHELGLTRIGKSSKNKSMALKAKSSDTNESLNNEDSKMKSYTTRQFKNFMKNANAKEFNKDRARTYVFHMLRTYVMILCNWLIF